MAVKLIVVYRLCQQQSKNRLQVKRLNNTKLIWRWEIRVPDDKKSIKLVALPGSDDRMRRRQAGHALNKWGD
jgi:hypothetical protein